MKRTVSFTLGLFLFSLLSLTALTLPAGQAPTAQLVTTVQTGKALAVVAAWSPDGSRLAYGTEKEVERRFVPPSQEGKAMAYPAEVWITNLRDKPKRILKDDFLRGYAGDYYSYSVEQLVWSPDGTKLAVEITDERKNTGTFFFTAKGKKIKMDSSRDNYVAGYGGGWLGDSESLGLLSEAVKPRLLHRVRLVRVTSGRAIPLFGENRFAAAAWLPQSSKAVLVERDPEFARPPRLLLGDLKSGRLETLAELSEGYVGGLQASPDESHVSYFVEQEKLAVQRLEPEAPVEHWPIPFGRYAWAGSQAVLFIEAEKLGRPTGWLTFYDPAQGSKHRLLPEEVIYDFWVTPDGQRLAVLTAGSNPAMKIYHLSLPSPTP